MIKLSIILLFIFCFTSVFAQTSVKQEKSPILFNLTANNDTICLGDTVQINASISGGDGGPYSFFDNFGTQINLPYIVQPYFSTSYIFTAKDNSGNQTKDTINIFVGQPPPNSFTFDLQDGCVPLTVHFTFYYPDNGQTYLWDFGDTNSTNNSSTIKNPVHNYYSEGIFSVLLTVTSIYGCASSLVYNDIINVYPKPDANFSFSPTISNVNDTIQFTDLSTNSANWSWNFGDGDSSSLQNPTHVYTNIGLYQVTLIVTSDHGCSDTSMTTKTVDINENNFNKIIKFYPNPTNDKIIIETLSNLIVDIINSKGQLIKHNVLTSIKNVIETKDLTNDIYTIRFQTDNNIFTRKFIKQ